MSPAFAVYQHKYPQWNDFGRQEEVYSGPNLVYVPDVFLYSPAIPVQLIREETFVSPKPFAR